MSEMELQLMEMKDTKDSVARHKKAQVRKNLMKLKISFDMVGSEEKAAYIGELMEYAFYEKTGEYRNATAATDAYKSILQLDHQNPEAHYRYAYLHYAKRSWLKAIEHFQQALKVPKKDESNFPLAEDQVIKAKLFIGYCAAQIAKESLKEANALNHEAFNLVYEGISIEDLSNQLKQQLQKTEFTLITPKGTQGVSSKEYIEVLDALGKEQLLISFVEDQPFIQLGDDAKNTISPWDGVILKRLLMKSVNDLPVTLAELNGFLPEIETVKELTWANYRQQVRRINQRLKESGFAENPIVADAGMQRYRIHIQEFLHRCTRRSILINEDCFSTGDVPAEEQFFY